ncbi:MAG: hypothetical protein H5T95_08110 [Firmicutes bacterium]|nr:hypothetical protein [Bacillota bacterium]
MAEGVISQPALNSRVDYPQVDTAENVVTASQALWGRPMPHPDLARIQGRIRGDRTGRRLPVGLPSEPELRRRYRDVFVGFKQIETREHVVERLVDFEEVLADLEANSSCRAAGVKCLTKDASGCARNFVVANCPHEKHGHEGYYAWSVATHSAGRPVLAYCNCGDPLERRPTPYGLRPGAD